MILGSMSAHGAGGTWVDEFIELGIPISIFIGLWWWANRKEKRRDRRPHHEKTTSEFPITARASRPPRDDPDVIAAAGPTYQERCA